MTEVHVFNVGNDLVKAYVGYHEDEWLEEFHEEFAGVNLDEDQWEDWARNRAINKIINHTPMRRLQIYLEWNGIIGYSGRIYELATGHF